MSESTRMNEQKEQKHQVFLDDCPELQALVMQARQLLPGLSDEEALAKLLSAGAKAKEGTK